MGAAFSLFQQIRNGYIPLRVEQLLASVITLGDVVTDYLILYSWYWESRVEQTDFLSHAIYMALFITILILRHSKGKYQEQWYYQILQKYEEKEKRSKEMKKCRKRSKEMRKRRKSLKKDLLKTSNGGTSPEVDEDDEEEKG